MVDWDRVCELRGEVGEEDFLEVVEIFLEEVEEVITRMRQSPDPNSYEADLHFLKGSALNLGFKALSDACSAGEKAARDGQAESVDIQNILSIYEMSMAEFLAGSAQRNFAA